VAVEVGVDENGSGQREAFEVAQDAPRADAVAVIAPRIIEHVGFGCARHELLGQPLAERVVLEVERDVEREPPAVRPCELRPADDRLVAEAAVRAEQPALRELAASPNRAMIAGRRPPARGRPAAQLPVRGFGSEAPAAPPAGRRRR
jgi:hypothetical protein